MLIYYLNSIEKNQVYYPFFCFMILLIRYLGICTAPNIIASILEEAIYTLSLST